MARFDLNGDPLPDDTPPVQPSAQPQHLQYDLAGNPLPAQTSYSQPHTQNQPQQSPYGQMPYNPPMRPQMPTQPSGNMPPYGQASQYGQQAPPYGQTASYDANNQPLTYHDGQKYRFKNEPKASSAELITQWSVGLVLCFVFAILGSMLVMKILSTGFGFAYFYIIVGAATGWAARYAAGNAGFAAAGIALVIVGLGMFIGHIYFTSLIMQKYPNTYGGEAVMTVFPVLMANLKPTHWLFVLLSFAGSIGVALKDNNTGT